MHTTGIEEGKVLGPHPRLAFAVAALLAVAGCATGRPPSLDIREATNTFHVQYGPDGCPTGVSAQNANCDPDPGTGQPPSDCMKISRKAKDKVGFKVQERAKPKGDFEIHFDPFRKTPAFKGTSGALPLDPAAPYKTYTFYVVAAGCPVLDPVIIVLP